MANFHFGTRAAASGGSAFHVAVVEPNDTEDLPGGVCRGIYVGGEGILSFVDASGKTVELLSGQTQYHPVMAKRIRASETTATMILALY